MLLYSNCLGAISLLMNNTLTYSHDGRYDDSIALLAGIDIPIRVQFELLVSLLFVDTTRPLRLSTNLPPFAEHPGKITKKKKLKHRQQYIPIKQTGGKRVRAKYCTENLFSPRKKEKPCIVKPRGQENHKQTQHTKSNNSKTSSFHRFNILLLQVCKRKKKKRKKNIKHRNRMSNAA